MELVLQNSTFEVDSGTADLFIIFKKKNSTDHYPVVCKLGIKSNNSIQKLHKRFAARIFPLAYNSKMYKNCKTTKFSLTR